MGVEVHRLMTKSRVALGSIVISISLLLPVGVALPSSGATLVSTGESAFCKTLLSFNTLAPTTTKFTTYRTWAKAYLPYYEKLLSTAPNPPVKKVLSELVTMMKAGASAASAKALSAYMAANRAKWTSGWKSLTKAVSACITSSVAATG